jgi:hypothetical protein
VPNAVGDANRDERAHSILSFGILPTEINEQNFSMFNYEFKEMGDLDSSRRTQSS